MWVGVAAAAGIFLHGALGAGYGAAFGEDIFDDRTALSGPIGTLDLQLGWSLRSDLALAIDCAMAGSTLLKAQDERQSGGVIRVGAAVTYYATDSIYLSAAGGPSFGEIYAAGFGFGLGGQVVVSYEWSVGPSVAVGIEARAFYEGLVGWFIIPVSSWNIYGGSLAVVLTRR